MKHIIILLTFSICTSIYAQKKVRNIDLKVVLEDSQAFKSILSPNNYPVTMYVINKGPDSLLHGDRLWVEFKSQSTVHPPTFPFIKRSIGIGDTFTYLSSIWLHYEKTYWNINIGGFAEIISSTKDSIPKEDHLKIKDNEDYYKITAKSTLSTNAITKNISKIKVFPNPVNGILYVETTLQNPPILYTMDMKEVAAPITYNTKFWEVNMQALANGIYFIKSNNQTFKVIKQ